MAGSSLHEAITPPTFRSSTQEDANRISTSPRSPSKPMVSSDDDLAAIGLPMEQYKPRPSRSRSLKLDTGPPIDYSVRSERTKKTSKRRKTTTAVSDTDIITTPAKIRQICEMGFTPSTTERALKLNNGNIPRTVDWLVQHGGDEDELASACTPGKKPISKGSEAPQVDQDTMQAIMQGLNDYRRQDSKSTPTAVDAPDLSSTVVQDGLVHAGAVVPILDEGSKFAQGLSPKVQVVIPQKSPRTKSIQALPTSGTAASKRAKRRKTTLDQPEQISPPENGLDRPNLSETKRGRGRPKKSAEAVPLANPAPLTETTKRCSRTSAPNEQPIELPPIEATSDNPQKTSSEPQLGGYSGAVQIQEEDESSVEKTPAAGMTEMMSSNKTTDVRTPDRLAKPLSHSPKDKGTVRYRVGLSKRARIAPLLRTLKK